MIDYKNLKGDELGKAYLIHLGAIFIYNNKYYLYNSAKNYLQFNVDVELVETSQYFRVENIECIHKTNNNSELEFMFSDNKFQTIKLNQITIYES